MKVRSIWIKSGVASIMAAGLMLQGGESIFIVHQAQAAAAKSVTLSGQAVSLSATSRLSIRDAHFLMQDKGKVLAYTVMITNTASKSLDLSDYWLRVKSKSGKSFKSTVIEGDKEKTSVPANTSQYITYYAVIDSATKLNDLVFEVVKWDFSAANYERNLGKIAYPAQASDQIAAYQPGTMLYGSGKLKGAVKQAFITKDKDNGYVTINYLLENVGQQVIDLSKTVFNLQTQSLSVYNVSAVGLEGLAIQPRERKVITLRSTIPASVVSKPLSMVVSINDEASKVSLPTGVFSLPSLKTQAPSEAGQPRVVYMDGQPVTTTAGQAFLNQSSGGQALSIDFSLTNTGTSSAATGAFDFFLVTKAGASYALTYTKEENASLLPGIAKTISLSGNVPSSVTIADSQLLMKSTATEKVKSYVIGAYSLQAASQEGGLGSAFSYNDYSVQLKSINRMPNQDNDMLVANMSITNTSSVAKQIPVLGGYFMVNGVRIGTEQKAVSLDQSVTLAPGATLEAIVSAEIPYSTSIQQISFVSTEPAADKPGKMLYQFTGQQLSEIKTSTIGTPYVIDGTGQKSSISIKRTAIYKSDAAQTFYTELEAVNKEARTAQIASIGGYLVDKNGLSVPIQFAELKDRISPEGKALLSAWAQLPRAFSGDSYQLVLGQTVGSTGSVAPPSTEQPSSGGSSGSTGTANPSTPITASVLAKPTAYTFIGSAADETANSLKDLKIGGYSLSLTKTALFLNAKDLYTVDGLRLQTTYSLQRDSQYEAIAGTHKLVVEVVNQDNNKTTVSKTFQIGAGVQGSTDDILKEGQDIDFKIFFSDPDIQSKLQSNSKYRLNLYDVFQGSQIRIASKEYPWFIISE
ncbi:hypothetical protein [Paenibacillus humicus]|uniref:hypothetical protein n=1 Tax=Paenibacillus humicus TaxID=412861 RepID=UPI000FDA71CE|nr:hypothetical protein [Paenibacillus humicus]